MPVLLQLQSPLTELDVTFPYDYKNPVLPLLANFHQTLESLTLICVNLANSTMDFCLSRLTSLDISTHTSPQLYIFIAAFPNLQNLCIRWVNYNSDAVDLLRNQNTAFQNSGHSWKALRSLVANTTSLDVIALQQELEILAVTTNLSEIPDDHLFGLYSSFPLLRPKTLSLVSSAASIFEGILNTAGLGRIFDLSLDLRLAEDSRVIPELVSFTMCLAECAL